MLGVVDDIKEGIRGHQVVGEASNETGLSSSGKVSFLPDSEKSDNRVCLESLVEDVAEEVQVGYKCSLEDDRCA